MELNAKFSNEDNKAIENRIDILQECIAMEKNLIDTELYAVQLDMLMNERCARIEKGIWNLPINTVVFAELSKFARIRLQIEERLQGAKGDAATCDDVQNGNFFFGRVNALQELIHDMEYITK